MDKKYHYMKGRNCPTLQGRCSVTAVANAVEGNLSYFENYIGILYVQINTR
jgi:hypothetical protein